MGHLLGQRAQYHAPKQMWHFKILVGLFACSSQLIHLMWFDLGQGGGVKFELAFHVRDTGTGLDLNGFHVEAEGFWDWN